MKTKLSISLALLAAVVLLAPPLAAQSDAVPAKPHQMPPRLSPHETIYQRIGPDRRNTSLVSITYGRPYSAKGGKGEPRKIWGELVKWDKADRLGADEATLILLQDPILIGDTTIPAGAYTLYIVPSEHGTSKLAFSSHLGKWGIPVDEGHDVARVDLKKETLQDQVDQLTLAIDNTPPEGGLLRIMWEKTQFSVPFKIKKA
jgi:hypothetical protein